jgi:hypothetical protein
LLGDASGLFWNGPLIWGRLSWRWDNFSSKYQLSWKIQQKTLFIPAIQLGADANNTVSSKRDKTTHKNSNTTNTRHDRESIIWRMKLNITSLRFNYQTYL